MNCPYCKKELTKEADGFHCYPCERLFHDCNHCKHYFATGRWCSIFDREVLMLADDNKCRDWEGRENPVIFV